MEHQTKIYVDPIQSDSLRELLLYFCDQGVGLRKSGESPFPKWTDISLEAALANQGLEVDRRSIQSWLSGTSIPKGDKLRALAQLASSNRYEREKWSSALLRLRRQAIDKRKFKTPGQDAPTDATSDLWQLNRFALTPILGSVFVACAFLFMMLSRPSSQSVASSIEFCEEADFDMVEKRCEVVRTSFSPGFRTLMVTFDLPGVPEGGAFTRKWYRNGRLIHEKRSFKDDAWPGYTYWHWPDGFDTGRYTLQIVHDGQATTAQFQTGETEGELVFR